MPPAVWAAGAQTAPDILTRICRFHYHSGRFQYGASNYAELDFFKMKRFFDHLSELAVQEVNCADCASIVTIFGGLLGAAGVNAEVASDTGYLLASTILFVGGEKAPGAAFAFHEVGWDVKAENIANVWDLCLGSKVGGQAEPFTAIRFRNAAAPQTTYPALSCQPSTAKHLQLEEFLARAVKDTALILDLNRPIDPTRLPPGGWILRPGDNKGLAFENFVPGPIRDILPAEIYLYEKQPKPWLTDTLYRYDQGRLHVSVFTCNSRQQALLALRHLLADRRDNPALSLSREPIGDVLFYDKARESTLLFFVRGNLVIRLQRSRGSGISLIEDAQLIDDMLMADLNKNRMAAGLTDEIIREELPVNAAGAGLCVRYSCATDEIGSSEFDGTVTKLL